MWIKLLDSFPGDSKGKTKNVDDITARQLIASGQAVAVADPNAAQKTTAKADTDAGKRLVKTDKQAAKADDK